jgi:hypothetical protein
MSVAEVENAKKEAAFLKSLNHSNIVRCAAVGVGWPRRSWQGRSQFVCVSLCLCVHVSVFACV